MASRMVCSTTDDTEMPSLLAIFIRSSRKPLSMLILIVGFLSVFSNPDIDIAPLCVFSDCRIYIARTNKKVNKIIIIFISDIAIFSVDKVNSLV